MVNTRRRVHDRVGRAALLRPFLGSVLADQAVDRLADEVGMPGMPGVLLDHVDKDSAQAERLVPAGDDDTLIQPPLRQHPIGRCLRALDGRRPHGVSD